MTFYVNVKCCKMLSLFRLENCVNFFKETQSEPDYQSGICTNHILINMPMRNHCYRQKSHSIQTSAYRYLNLILILLLYNFFKPSTGRSLL
ncbi:hypothetical protein C3B55_00606 [Candidatus Pseudomonas adelgestsugas]|uniref:Transposase DDE domain-containing protein n=1 Tax=Candidatus Pseudomonas adelgestsugas TaxID=1302376 RepID=A0ABX5R8Q2_9PSED|nr:hypothetical protein C3B55_00606 [Candidatus Pseudomonas adelgestsugas]